MAEAVRAGAGGIAGLAHLLREHGEAVEWDIAHYWPGRSLLELYRGEMSWRELRVFLRYLPPDSCTAREIHPRDAVEEWWTPERMLTATLIDSVRITNYLLVKLHGDPKKTRGLKPPDPIERPGVESRQKTIRFAGRHGAGQLGQAFTAKRAS